MRGTAKRSDAGEWTLPLFESSGRGEVGLFGSPPIILGKVAAHSIFIVVQNRVGQPTAEQPVINQSSTALACEYPRIPMSRHSIVAVAVIPSNDWHASESSSVALHSEPRRQPVNVSIVPQTRRQ